MPLFSRIAATAAGPPPSAFELNEPDGPASADLPRPAPRQRAAEAQAGRSHLTQLVLLRWLAVGGQLVTVLGVHYVLDLHLPLAPMLLLLAALSLFNLASAVRARTAREVSQAELLLNLMVDIALLSGQLAFSGGIHNPFVFLFLPQVAIGAMLLRRGYVWVPVIAASLAMLVLARWYVPLNWPGEAEHRLSMLYVAGLVVCFSLCASLVVMAIERIGDNLRRRDARLTALKQRAAEEDHIVRMGLLASGAAHELGTPLATLSVILGDWSRMAPFAAEPELREDLEQMQTQVQRCKAIITGILMSAGDSRADAPRTTTLADFLADVAGYWQQRRARPDFTLEAGPLPDDPIIADTGLRQMITNVLDNALEADPDRTPRLIAQSDGDWLELRVLDRGAGFAPDVLAGLGLPYRSTKGRPGGGLGLFLSLNVARKLGGNLRAANRGTGGAEVLIELPLSALLAPADDRDLDSAADSDADADHDLDTDTDAGTPAPPGRPAGPSTGRFDA